MNMNYPSVLDSVHFSPCKSILIFIYFQPKIFVIHGETGRFPNNFSCRVACYKFPIEKFVRALLSAVSREPSNLLPKSLRNKEFEVATRWGEVNPKVTKVLHMVYQLLLRDIFNAWVRKEQFLPSEGQRKRKATVSKASRFPKEEISEVGE